LLNVVKRAINSKKSIEILKNTQRIGASGLIFSKKYGCLQVYSFAPRLWRGVGVRFN
jgi:hypothetical protein